MKAHNTRTRAVPVTLLAMTGAAWGLGSATSPASAAAANAAKTQTITGVTEYVDHGPVRAQIVVKNRKIVAVRSWNSPEDNRSVVIQSNALPVLRGEALRAQSASINVVSGATDTSYGFINSLQSAITKARRTHALK